MFWLNEINDTDVFLADKAEDDTFIVTSMGRFKEKILSALDSYDPGNRKYSAYLSTDASSSTTLTSKYINEQADGAQDSLTKIKTINSIVRTLINSDDIIGITYEAIDNNVNTEFTLSYREFKEKRNKTKSLEKARIVIDEFNEQIGLKSLIRKSVPLVYSEGNYIMYLRGTAENYTIDYYPLGVAVISDYEVNGHPVVMVNINELTSRLNKTYLKNKRGQALFFENIDKEIQTNYPAEVYTAYKNKDQYAVLDPERTGVIRINNLNRKYGLTPMFKAVKPHLMLENFDTSDATNTKAKGKKIIHQTLRKELLGEHGDRDSYNEMAYAHENLMLAWKMPTVVVTTPPYVEKIEYVEPTTELTNINTVNQYRNRVMSALGVSFLNTDGTQTVSTANISLKQLMNNINKITEQLEDIMKRYYKIVLTENNIGLEFCPTISIIDAELLEFDMKKDLSEFLFTKLSCSYETAYRIVGLDLENEKQLRESENAQNLDTIFAPRLTAYTNSPGRPSDDNPENPIKQEQDKVNNDAS